MSSRNYPQHLRSSSPEWVNEIINNLKSLLNEAMTPQIEKALRQVSVPVLRELEKLLNPNTNWTQQRVILRWEKMMAATDSRFDPTNTVSNDDRYSKAA
jgi:hypothetical protein